MSQEAKYSFSVLNVGQGSLQLIEEGDKINIVIDCNLQSAPELVWRYFARRKVKQIDLLILSGKDTDHADFDGLELLKKRYTIKRIWYPNFKEQEETDNWKKVRKLIAGLEKCGTIVETPTAGHSFDIGSLNLKVLSPHNDDSTTSNNASIVVRVLADEVAATFPGDCEIPRWENILKYFKKELATRVFLVPHHGSEDGCNDEVLRAVNPEYSIVSAGEDNKFGHPDKKILKLLEKNTSRKVYITYRDGSILFESDGKTITNVVTDAGQDDEGKKEEVKAVAAAFGSRASVFVSPRGILSAAATAGSVAIRSTVSHGGREAETDEQEADTRLCQLRLLTRT